MCFVFALLFFAFTSHTIKDLLSHHYIIHTYRKEKRERSEERETKKTCWRNKEKLNDCAIFLSFSSENEWYINIANDVWAGLVKRPKLCQDEVDCLILTVIILGWCVLMCVSLLLKDRKSMILSLELHWVLQHVFLRDDKKTAFIDFADRWSETTAYSD